MEADWPRPTPPPYTHAYQAPAAATGSRKKKAEAADEEQQPPEWQQPDTKRARSGKATLRSVSQSKWWGGGHFDWRSNIDQ